MTTPVAVIAAPRPPARITDHNGDLLATVSAVEEYAQVVLADGNTFRLDQSTCTTLAEALLSVFAKPEVDAAHAEPDVSEGQSA